MDKEMTGTAEKLAEHLYGHSREKAIEWAKEDKFDSCYRNAEDIIELLLADGWRQCAKGQHTSQFCGQLEAAVSAERAVSDRLLEALKTLVDRDVTYIGGLATFSYAEIKSARETLTEVEAIRKEKPE